MPNSELAESICTTYFNNTEGALLRDVIDAELQEVREVIEWVFSGPGSGAWTYAMHEPECAWQTEPNPDSCNCRVQRARALWAKMEITR